MGQGIRIEGFNLDMPVPKGLENEVYSLAVIMGIDTSSPSQPPCTVSEWEFNEEETQKMIDDYKATGKFRMYQKIWGFLPPSNISPLPFVEVDPYTEAEITAMRNGVNPHDLRKPKNDGPSE